MTKRWAIVTLRRNTGRRLRLRLAHPVHYPYSSGAMRNTLNSSG